MSVHRPGERGISLVEVVILVAVLGIVALVSQPLLSSSLGDANLSAAAEEIVIAVQHAQRAAVSQGMDHRVTFDKTLDTIVVERAAPDSAVRSALLDDLVGQVIGGSVESEPWGVVGHPLKLGRRYRVDFGEARFRGVDVTVVNFATRSWVSFDDRGAPSSGGTVQVQLGGAGYRLSVDEVTGIVTRAKLTPGEMQEATL